MIRYSDDQIRFFNAVAAENYLTINRVIFSFMF
jgi:hypothetical protein